jgi:hypothetical protein
VERSRIKRENKELRQNRERKQGECGRIERKEGTWVERSRIGRENGWREVAD